MLGSITSNVASRIRGPGPDAGLTSVERPGLARRLWSVLVVVAAFTAFGVIVWLAHRDVGLGPPVGEPPLVKAAAEPLKRAPNQAEESALAAEQGTVGRLWSDADQADQPERLLPSPEEPLSPPAIEEQAGLPPVSEPGAATQAAAGQGSEVGTATPPAAAAVTERPPTDQSLQEAEAALDRLLAEVTAISEDADVPGATPEAPAERQARVEPPPEQQASSAPEPAPATASAPPAERTGAPPETPPLPQVRPAGAVSAERAAEPAPPDGATETAALSAPTARPAAAADGDFRIQLAAVREEADARRAWQLFTADLGPALRGVEPIFERAETANGVFYRVQAGPFVSQEAADAVCQRLKQRNVSCFVIRR